MPSDRSGSHEPGQDRDDGQDSCSFGHFHRPCVRRMLPPFRSRRLSEQAKKGAARQRGATQPTNRPTTRAVSSTTGMEPGRPDHADRTDDPSGYMARRGHDRCRSAYRPMAPPVPAGATGFPALPAARTMPNRRRRSASYPTAAAPARVRSGFSVRIRKTSSRAHGYFPAPLSPRASLKGYPTHPAPLSRRSVKKLELTYTRNVPNQGHVVVEEGVAKVLSMVQMSRPTSYRLINSPKVSQRC